MTYQEFVEKWNKESLASEKIRAEVVDGYVYTIRFYHTSNDKLMMELTFFDHPDGARSKSLRIKDNSVFSPHHLRLLSKLMSSDNLGVNSKKYWFPIYSKDSMVGFATPSYYKIGFSSDFDNVKFYTEDVLELIKNTFEEGEWDDLMKFKQVFAPIKRKEKDNSIHD